MQEENNYVWQQGRNVRNVDRRNRKRKEVLILELQEVLQRKKIYMKKM